MEEPQAHPGIAVGAEDFQPGLGPAGVLEFPAGIFLLL
jgi:hypothetical protein